MHSAAPYLLTVYKIFKSLMCLSAECLHASQHIPVSQAYGGQCDCPQFAGRGPERSCPGSYNQQVDDGWGGLWFEVCSTSKLSLTTSPIN